MKKNQKNKFNTPEGYFESFNERLMNRLQAEEEITPGDIIPKTDGFSAPKDYFEKFSVVVPNQNQEPNTKVVTLSSYRKFYFAAAAIAALLMLTFVWKFNSTPSLEFNDLGENEIAAYFDDVDLELSSYEIAEVLPVDGITMNDITETELDDEQVLEYLEDAVEDFDELNLDYEEFDQ